MSYFYKISKIVQRAFKFSSVSVEYIFCSAEEKYWDLQNCRYDAVKLKINSN